MDEQNKGNKCAEKTVKAIKFISLGKYPTPLFYQKQDSYSSLLSGLCTLGFILVMITISIFIFVPIFEKETKELNMKSVQLTKVSDLGKYEIQDCDGCLFLTVEDCLGMMDGIDYEI